MTTKLNKMADLFYNINHHASFKMYFVYGARYGVSPCIKSSSIIVSVCRFYSIRRPGTYYEVLGVPKNASKREIKSAFIKLSKLHHPDTSHSSSSSKRSNKSLTNSSNNDRFVQITEAYKTLSNPRLKSEYDYELKIGQDYYTANYAGSRGYTNYYRTTGFSSPTNNYHYNGDLSQQDEDFFIHVHPTSSSQQRHKSHGKLIVSLILLVVIATGFHSFRIGWAHRTYQQYSDKETERNQLIYDSVRAKARTRTIQEQLASLNSKQSSNLNKIKPD